MLLTKGGCTPGPIFHREARGLPSSAARNQPAEIIVFLACSTSHPWQVVLLYAGTNHEIVHSDVIRTLKIMNPPGRICDAHVTYKHSNLLMSKMECNVLRERSPTQGQQHVRGPKGPQTTAYGKRLLARSICKTEGDGKAVVSISTSRCSSSIKRRRYYNYKYCTVRYGKLRTYGENLEPEVQIFRICNLIWNPGSRLPNPILSRQKEHEILTSSWSYQLTFTWLIYLLWLTGLLMS